MMLLVFFVLLLAFSFSYLLKIYKNIENYGLYEQKLQNLITLDLTLETVFLKKYSFINSDSVLSSSRSFEKIIESLKMSRLEEEFGKESYQELLAIEQLHRSKIELSYRFLAPNARAANAIHYLFDLRKTIENKYPGNQQKHAVLDEILFELGRVMMGSSIETKRLSDTLKEIQTNTPDEQYYIFFAKQVEQFIDDTELMNRELAQNKHIFLQDAIKKLALGLSAKYEQNKKIAQSIVKGFFLAAFLNLLLLIYFYYRLKRKTVELKAFRYAIENSDNTIVITDADRNITFVNEAFELSTGYSKDEALGKKPSIMKSFIHGDDFYREMNTMLDHGEKWQGELINSRKDGTLFYEKASIVPIIIHGELVQYLAVKLDITEYIEQRQRLQQAAVVFEATADGVLIVDRNRHIIAVNSAYLEIFGYAREEIEGRESDVVTALERDTYADKKILTALTAKGHYSGKIESQTKDGKSIPVWLTITLVRDKSGDIQNYIIVYTNLEEVIEMEAKANFLAYHDSLTLLPNRAYIERDLAAIFERAKETGELLAFFFIDLDRFKVINDSLGHIVGDEMLVEVAQRLVKCAGERALVARFGGDEFVIICSSHLHKKSIGKMAEKILSVVREPIKVDDYSLNTTASIGIALFPDDAEDTGTIIKYADSAMYHAKQRGKDNYQFYTYQLSLDMETRLKIEQKLLHALERGELSLQYQPQYELKTKRLCGAEALLRWNSPELGAVSPEYFISVAEETGMIVKIGYFILEEAAKAYLHWKEEGVELEWIAINLSSAQFRQEDMLAKFQGIIDDSGIAMGNLEFEITERCMLEYSQENLGILDELRKRGGFIAIDDFGTGYSSMSYLKTLSIDKLKIDKSFVEGLPADVNDKEVTTAIIALSHSLGYKVVAEGIETKAQEDFLIGQGCEYGQGYYFSRPLESDALIEFAKRREKESK